MILNGGMPGNPRTSGFVSDADEGFTLFFANQFIHERLDLADGYFGKNAIKDSVIVYRGGKPQFERSNTLTDCDLEVAKGLSPDSPGLKQLLHDFKWRSVSYGVNVPPRR